MTNGGEKEARSLDREIIYLQKSTRTTVPAMLPLHDILRQKFHWYYRWHLWRGAKFLHLVILLGFMAFIGNMFYQIGFGNPKTTSAANVLTMTLKLGSGSLANPANSYDFSEADFSEVQTDTSLTDPTCATAGDCLVSSGQMSQQAFQIFRVDNVTTSGNFEITLKGFDASVYQGSYGAYKLYVWDGTNTGWVLLGQANAGTIKTFCPAGCDVTVPAQPASYVTDAHEIYIGVTASPMGPTGAGTAKTDYLNVFFAGATYENQPPQLSQVNTTQLAVGTSPDPSANPPTNMGSVLCNFNSCTAPYVLNGADMVSWELFKFASVNNATGAGRYLKASWLGSAHNHTLGGEQYGGSLWIFQWDTNSWVQINGTEYAGLSDLNPWYETGQVALAAATPRYVSSSAAGDNSQGMVWLAFQKASSVNYPNTISTSEITLETLGASYPALITYPAEGVAADSAWAKYQIIDTGGANATVRGVKWYDNLIECQTGAAPVGTITANGSFGAGTYGGNNVAGYQMTGLASNTQYWYGAYATNPNGTVFDASCPTFTTLAVADITISGSGSAGAGVVAINVNHAGSNSTPTTSATTWNGTAWSVTISPQPQAGDVITAYLNNAIDSAESTAVTLVATLGADISGMVLDPNVLSIGSADNRSLTAAQVGVFTNTNNENVMISWAANVLNVCGGGASPANCSTPTPYADPKINILAGNTLTIGAASTNQQLIAHNLTITGTLVAYYDAPSTNRATISLYGNWDSCLWNAGTSTCTNGVFTYNYSTVESLGSGSIEPANPGYFYNLKAAYTGKTTTGTHASMRIQNDLTTETGNWAGTLTYLNKNGDGLVDGGATFSAAMLYTMSANQTVSGAHNFTGNVIFYASVNGATYSLSTDLTSTGGAIVVYGSSSLNQGVLDSNGHNLSATNLSVGSGSDRKGKIYLRAGTHTFSGDIVRNGSNNTSGEIDFGTSNTTVGGSIDFTGINVTKGTGASTITMNSAVAGETITSTNGGVTQLFNNLVFNTPSSGTWEFKDAAHIDGDFTITAGTVILGAFSHTMSGNVTLGGTVTLPSPSSNSTITMDGGSKSIIGNGKGLGNLTINNPSTPSTVSAVTPGGNNNLYINGTLLVKAGNTLSIDGTTGQSNTVRVILNGGSAAATIENTASVIKSSSAGRLDCYNTACANMPTTGTLSADTAFYSGTGGSDFTVPSRAYGGNVYLVNTDTNGTNHNATLGTGAGQTITIDGFLNVQTGSTGYLNTTSSSNLTLTVGTVGAPTYLYYAQSSTGVPKLNTGTGTWTINGSINLTKGELTGGGGNINVSRYLGATSPGTWTLGNGTWTFGEYVDLSNITVTANSSTLRMNGSAAQTLKGNGQTLNNLQISNGTTLTTSDLTVGGTLTVDNTKTFTIDTGRTLTQNGATATLTGVLADNGIFAPAAGTTVGGAGTINGSGLARVTKLGNDAFSLQYTVTTKTLGSLTVQYAGGGAQTVSAISYGPLEINMAGQTATLGGTVTCTNLTITAGTLAGSDKILNVSGNFTKTGTFTANTSTVNLTGGNGTTQTLSGSITFNNLSATAAAERTIKFTDGSTTVVSGTWTAQGAGNSAGQWLILTGTTGTAIWTVNPTAATVSNVNVSWSKNTGVKFCAGTSTDGGNNVAEGAGSTGWFFSSTASCSPPGLTNLTGTATGTGSIRWNFTNGGTPASTAIKVYNSDGSETFQCSGNNLTSCEETGLPSPNTSYSRKVKAVNGFGVSDAFSNTVGVYTKAAVPSAPSNVTAQSWNNGNPVQLTLQANGNPASTDYFFQYKEVNTADCGDATGYLQVSGNWVALTQGQTQTYNQTADKYICYRVKAKNHQDIDDNIYSASSTPVQAAPAQPGFDAGDIHGPNNVSGHSGNTTSSITWAWGANTVSPDGYKIYEDNAGTCLDGVAPKVTTAATSGAESTGLSANTSYRRCIEAYRGSIHGQPTAGFSAFTSANDPATGATAHNAVAGHSGNAVDGITWTWASGGAQKDFCPDDSSDLAPPACAGATSWNASGSHVANTQYTLTVYARNGDDDASGNNTHSAYTSANDPVTGVTADNGVAGHSGNAVDGITWTWATGGTEKDFCADDTSNLAPPACGAATSWNASGSHAANTQYSVTVYARNGDNDASGNNVHSAYTSANDPVNPSHSGQSTSGITWTWASGGAQKDFCPDDSSNLAPPACGVATSWNASGSHAANTQYTLTVNARNGDNDQTGNAVSNAYSAIETPTAITATPQSISQIDLSVTNSLSNLTSGSSGISFTELTNRQGSGADNGFSNAAPANQWLQSNGVSDTGLGTNTQYLYSVTARNGDGQLSDEVTIDPLNRAELYTKIENALVALDTSEGSLTPNSIRLLVSNSLSNLADGQSGVQFSETSANAGGGIETGFLNAPLQANQWIKTTTVTDVGLTNNLHYVYKVQARNGDGLPSNLSDPGLDIQTPLTENLIICLPGQTCTKDLVTKKITKSGVPEHQHAGQPFTVKVMAAAPVQESGTTFKYLDTGYTNPVTLFCGQNCIADKYFMPPQTALISGEFEFSAQGQQVEFDNSDASGVLGHVVTATGSGGASDPFEVEPGLCSASLSSASAAPTPLEVNNTSTVTITLQDLYGNKLVGHGVSVSPDHADGLSPITFNQATTDANGQILAYVQSSTAGTYNLTVTDTTDTVVLDDHPSVQFTAVTVENPTNFAVMAGDARVRLTWTNPASFDHINIYRSLISGQLGAELTTATNETYVDTAVTNDVTYYYTLKAEDGSGNLSSGTDQLSATPRPSGGVSPSAGGTTPGTPSPSSSPGITDNDPTAPTNLRSTDIACNSVTLRWDASTDDKGVVGYQVVNAETDILIGVTDQLTQTFEGLSTDSIYKFKVRSYDTGGNYSGYSGTLSVTTLSASRCGVIEETAAIFVLGNVPEQIGLGEKFSGKIRVTVADQGGKIVTTYRKPVHFESTDKKAKLAAPVDNPYTFTAEDAGIHQFEGSEFALNTAGKQKVIVSDYTIESFKEVNVVSGFTGTETAEIVKDFFNKPDNISKANTGILVTSAAVLMAPLILNGLVGLSSILPQILYWFFQLLQIIGVRRRAKPWGVVFNSQTGQPVALAIVMIFERKYNKMLERSVTDPQGRYGFLTKPGEYYITVSKNGYTFPAKQSSSTFYERIYNSGPFKINAENQAISFNIPLDPATTKASVNLWIMMVRANKLLQKIRLPLLALGVLFAVIMLIIAYDKLYFLSLGFYVLIGILEYLRTRKARPYGVIADSYGHPIDMAIVRIYQKNTNRLVETDVSDSSGRFRFLVPPGIYYITAVKPGYSDFKSHLMYLEKERTLVSTTVKLKKIGN